MDEHGWSRMALILWQVRHMTKTGNITTVIISAMCLVLWVIVTAYYGSWDTKDTNWDLL